MLFFVTMGCHNSKPKKQDIELSTKKNINEIMKDDEDINIDDYDSDDSEYEFIDTRSIKANKNFLKGSVNIKSHIPVNKKPRGLDKLVQAIYWSALKAQTNAQNYHLTELKSYFDIDHDNNTLTPKKLFLKMDKQNNEVIFCDSTSIVLKNICDNKTSLYDKEKNILTGVKYDEIVHYDETTFYKFNNEECKFYKYKDNINKNEIDTFIKITYNDKNCYFTNKQNDLIELPIFTLVKHTNLDFEELTFKLKTELTINNDTERLRLVPSNVSSNSHKNASIEIKFTRTEPTETFTRLETKLQNIV